MIENLFGIATWGQVTFDPLRPRLYFVESTADKQKNRMTQRIMMMDTADSDAAPGSGRHHPVQLTAGPSDSSPAPSPDGKWLAFLSRRSGSHQVWRLPLNGGEAIQVTRIQGGVREFTWAPDGSGVVVVAHIKDGNVEREKAESTPTADAADENLEQHYNRDVLHITHQYYKLDGEGFFDEGRNQLVWVPFAGEPELLTDGKDHYADPVFSPDQSALYTVFRAYDPEGPHPSVTRVKMLAWSTRSWTQLSLPDWSIGRLQVSPDGKHLAFCAANPKDMGYGLTTLYRYGLVDETLTDLSSHLDRSVGDDSGTDIPTASSARPTWVGEKLLMLLSDAGRVMLAAFHSDGVTRLWDEKRVVYDFAVKGDEIALAIADPTHPSGLAIARRENTNPPVTWAPAPWDDNAALAPVAPEDIWATESDGTKVHTWCLRPTGQGPHPTILEIHGGPMSMYGYRYFHEFQCLVQAGYAVVYTNPRGSVGYGKHFCDAIVGEWGDKDYRDVMTGLDASLERWSDLDKSTLGVAGGSYGGFMVNWIVSHSERFRAAVTMRSVVNRFSAMGSSDMGWLRVPQYGTRPWWEEPEPYWQQSPLRYASNIHTPLLIEHQEKDFRLPIEQGEQLYSALKYLGRTVELVIYPNESHGMSRNGQPWHRVHRLRTNIGWFDKYLKG